MSQLISIRQAALAYAINLIFDNPIPLLVAKTFHFLEIRFIFLPLDKGKAVFGMPF